MSAARALAVVNRHASGGRAGRAWPAVRAALAEGGLDVSVSFTDGEGDATRLTRDAVAAGVTTVVCVGGDGTVNEVVNGLLADGPAAVGAARPELVVVPAGTGSDLARTLGLPRDPLAAARLAGSLTAVDVDAGRVAFNDAAGRPAVRWFANIADFGIGGLVVERVNRSPKVLGGRVSFALGTLWAIAAYRPGHLELEFDGTQRRSGRYTNVVVANGQFFGGGMHVAPGADAADGRFDCVLAEHRPLPHVLSGFASIYSGRHLDRDEVELLHARVVEVGGDPALLDVDGEQPGATPARFTLHDAALSVRARPREGAIRTPGGSGGPSVDRGG